MKKYLVIGNPIDHSQSPKLHNYWIKENNLNAVYEKKRIAENELKNLILEIKEKKINGANVTVPFKNKVIPFLDKLSTRAEKTQSVNTIYRESEKIIGDNTDIDGFELSLNNQNHNVAEKKVLILGGGGVVPSIIFALNKMRVSKIYLTNRTRSKAENLKILFKNLIVLDWGEIPDVDIVINATSVGLNKSEKIDFDFAKLGKNKFFYDVIYNPKQTEFLKKGKELGFQVQNGEMMFIYQAASAFKIWHSIYPKIDEQLIDLLNK